MSILIYFFHDHDNANVVTFVIEGDTGAVPPNRAAAPTAGDQPVRR